MNRYSAYKEVDLALADLYYMITGRRKYEAECLIPTSENRKKVEERLSELGDKVNQLEAFDKPSAIWKEHFQDFLLTIQSEIEHHFSGIFSSLYMISRMIENAYRIDLRENSVRLAIIQKYASQLEPLMDYFFSIETDDATKKRVKATLKADSELLLEVVDITEEHFDSLVNEVKETVCHLAEKMLQYSQDERLSYKESVLTIVNDDDQILKFEESYYRHVLHDKLGVELDELLSWYEEEVVNTRNEVYQIANRLDIEEKNIDSMIMVNNILNKYAGPYEDTKVMFEKGKEYLARARKEAHKILNLPEDESCLLQKTPRSLKFSFPWGGYEGTDPNSNPIVGSFFLNEVNHMAVTDGWIKMNSVHEAYPGHHCQHVRIMVDQIPVTATIGAKSIPLLEGTAHRSERMMEYMYSEDPFYALFVAYRRHHTAVRIKADLMLRYFGNPVKDVVKLYMDELGFDYTTARGQIKAQENMEGYFNCYYYGLKKLEDWEKKYQIDRKTFTEYLFSVGQISISNFEKFLQLNAEEKYSFTHDFRDM